MNEDQNTITITWHVDDVLQQCPHLTQDQALEVLHTAKDKHDANIGITWDTLEMWADYLYPQETP